VRHFFTHLKTPILCRAGSPSKSHGGSRDTPSPVSAIPDLEALDADFALKLLRGKTAGVFGNGSTLPRRPQNLDAELLARRDEKGYALLFKEDRRIGFARRQAMRQTDGARSADRWKNLGALFSIREAASPQALMPVSDRSGRLAAVNSFR
jgi:hypothetical protein